VQHNIRLRLWQDGSRSRIGRRSRIGCSPRSFVHPPGGPAFGRSRSRSPWPRITIQLRRPASAQRGAAAFDVAGGPPFP
jgi:hypothetical protein